jgi:CTP synthase (UTP-ammonia lyase)
VPVACEVPNRAAGAPKLSGAIGGITIKPGSLLQSIYQAEQVAEEFFCNYEVNAAYAPKLEAAGLALTALGAAGELRAVELPGHPFFLATLFQPQLSSIPAQPHPIVLAFLRAAQRFRQARRHAVATGARYNKSGGIARPASAATPEVNE